MTKNKSLSIGILTLPVELLLEIVSYLRIPDLRRLGRVNRVFYFFVAEYLLKYRYNAGLVALPNELVLEIVQHLVSQKDRSRLARTSQRFYPIVMDYIVRYNVRHKGSSLLNYAATKDLQRLTRAILSLGGDVNTQHGLTHRAGCERPTPLVVASGRGNMSIVRLLLQAGASHHTNGMRLALSAATTRRHEQIALLLSRKVDPSEIIFQSNRLRSDFTALQIACLSKLPALVRSYLARKQPKPGIEQELNLALFYLLVQNSTRGDFVKRELHNEVYEIVLMLLEHGADLDFQLRGHTVTISSIACTHPDPRVRALRASETSKTIFKESSLQIGRPWLDSFDSVAPKHRGATMEESETGRRAQLFDFCVHQDEKLLDSADEKVMEYRETVDEPWMLSSSDMTGIMFGIKWKSKTQEPPSLSSFPQLGRPQARKQTISTQFWAKLPQQAPQNEVPLQRPNSRTSRSESRKLEHLEVHSAKESFPPLGKAAFPQRNLGFDAWVGFQKISSNPSQGASGTQTTPSNEAILVQKTMKKKKWKPLQI